MRSRSEGCRPALSKGPLSPSLLTIHNTSLFWASTIHFVFFTMNIKCDANICTNSEGISIVFVYHLLQGGYIFTTVHFFGGWSAGLHKNYLEHLGEIRIWVQCIQMCFHKGTVGPWHRYVFYCVPFQSVHILKCALVKTHGTQTDFRCGFVFEKH